MNARPDDAHAVRERGSRRLSALTVGVTAASLMGVGVVAGYDAHLFRGASAQPSSGTSSTGTAGTGTSTTGSASGASTGAGHGDRAYGDDSGNRGDDDSGGGSGGSGSGQLQAPANPPVTTQQQPMATSGGS